MAYYGGGYYGGGGSYAPAPAWESPRVAAPSHYGGGGYGFGYGAAAPLPPPAYDYDGYYPPAPAPLPSGYPRPQPRGYGAAGGDDSYYPPPGSPPRRHSAGATYGHQQQQQQQQRPTPAITAPPPPRTGGLRERDLQQLNSLNSGGTNGYGAPPRGGGGGGGFGGSPSVGSIRRTRDHVIDLDARSSAAVSEVSTASSVGSGWRTLSNKKGRKKSVHRSRVPPPWRHHMGLCIGVESDDPASQGAAGLSCQAVHGLLARMGFTVETVVDAGEDSPQFRSDLEAAIGELIGLAQEGDSIVVYAINYSGRGKSASRLIERLAQGLRKGVRVTFVFDCCYLQSRPAYRMDWRQQRIPSAKYAGLKYLRRVARPMGPVNVQVQPDIFCFNGEDPSGKLRTFPKASGNHGVYTEAFVRALTDRERSGLLKKITYAELSHAIDVELKKVKFVGQPHSTTSEIFCTKAYDIDQPVYL